MMDLKQDFEKVFKSHKEAAKFEKRFDKMQTRMTSLVEQFDYDVRGLRDVLKDLFHMTE